MSRLKLFWAINGGARPKSGPGEGTKEKAGDKEGPEGLSGIVFHNASTVKPLRGFQCCRLQAAGKRRAEGPPHLRRRPQAALPGFAPARPAEPAGEACRLARARRAAGPPCQGFAWSEPAELAKQAKQLQVKRVPGREGE